MQTELFLTLFRIFKDEIPKFEWQEPEFRILIEAILVQNTAYKNVEKAMLNLKKANAINLDEILSLSTSDLANLIKPSGFYNTKAKRIQTLLRAIKQDFGDFDNFKDSVKREWLILVRGVGDETCDAILCYACGKAEMIADSYALRILNTLDYEFESYYELKEFLSSLDFDKIYKNTNLENENAIFRAFHILIIAFCKKYFKGKILDNRGLKILKAIKF